MNEAKSRYLKNAERFRVEYSVAKEDARKDYEKALEFAQHDYEFTVDIAKDQYKNEKAEAAVERGETSPDTGWFEMRQSPSDGLANPEGVSSERKSGDRPTMRLEDEIKQMVEESIAEWGPEFGQVSGGEENW